jgi:hypothetical protein
MPFIALAAGAAGFYVRLMELWNVFDERTGLPERGAGLTITLIAFSAAFLLAALLFAIRATVKHKAPKGFENAFGTDPLSYPMMFTLIGLVWLGATIKHFIDLNALGTVAPIELYYLILSALSAVSITFFAVEMYQDPRRKMAIALSIVPTLFMCFWLILMYRQNASNPILLSYAYQCLAIISAALGFYFTSGFVYNKPAPGKAIFTYLAAIYFCFITLADDHAMGVRLIIVAIITVNVIYASMLIRNLRWRES